MTDTPLTRVDGIHLLPEATIALDAAVELTGHSHTDVINAALRVYAQLLAEQNVGSRLVLTTVDGRHEELTLR